MLSICCLTVQTVGAVAAPCAMDADASDNALVEHDFKHDSAMSAMSEHAHHGAMGADQTNSGSMDITNSMSDCCNDSGSCSMTFCYSVAVLLNSSFEPGHVDSIVAHYATAVSGVSSAQTSLFRPPISV